MSFGKLETMAKCKQLSGITNIDKDHVRHNSKTSKGTLKKGFLTDTLADSEGAQACLFHFTPDDQLTSAHVFRNDDEEECKHHFNPAIQLLRVHHQ